MKLVIINYYQDKTNRGLETYVRELSIRLKASVWSSSSARVTAQIFPGVLRRLFLTPVDLSIFFFYLSHIPRLIQTKPDYLIITNCGWHLFIYRLISLILGTKLLLVGQSGPGWDDRINLLSAPDVFISLSPPQQTWARSVFHWPHTQLPVIPNGVNIAEFSRAKPSQSRLPHPRVICVAASIPSKNISAVISGIATHPQASLLLLGSGPLSTQLDQQAKIVLPDRYQRLTVSHQEVASYYRSSDVFILISDSSEAFGIAYLEALAAGLPVIATDDPLRKYIVGRSGVFISPQSSASQIASAIDKALRIKVDQSQLGSFTWDTIASQYQHLFKTLN